MQENKVIIEKLIRKLKKSKTVIAILLVISMVAGIICDMDFSKRYAGGVTAKAASASMKTIYFDTHGIGTPGYNGWSTNCDIYMYVYDSSGVNAAYDTIMTKSSRENSMFTSDGVLWELTVDTSKYTHIIFKNIAGWGDDAQQTVDVALSDLSQHENPLFILYGYDAATGKKTAECKGSLAPVSSAGEVMKFFDMTGGYNNVKAVFGGEGLSEVTLDMDVTNVPYSVAIPADVNDLPYQTVRFLDVNGNQLGDIYNFGGNASGDEIAIQFEANKTDTIYYGATEFADGTKSSFWGTSGAAGVSGEIAGKDLYFDKMFFPVGTGDAIDIGGTGEVLLTDIYIENNTYKYTIPADSTADRNTIITFKKSDGTKYHFWWADLTKNEVTLGTGETAEVTRTYDASVGMSVFFDATLSKLVYGGADGTNGGDYGIPNSGGVLRYYATGAGKTDIEGNMTLVPSYTLNGHTYNDVYRVDLPQGYEKIAFSSFDMSSITNYGAHGESTQALTIPTDIKTPCFYADTSDDYVYSSANVQRSGYWDELGRVRDPEKEGSDSDVNTIVDIPEGTEVREKDRLYLSSNFYDFYTDYELNGKNRDDYGYEGNNHRIYQPFRQFNQALSEYYKGNSAASPLYWGNFQNYSGSPYSEIAAAMNLFGSSDTNKFFYENNSMWGRDGNELGAPAGEYATQGLVSDTLLDGDLMIETTGGSVVKAPYFSEDYLNGNNSKNTVLGKVYEDVTFPFKKKPLNSQSAAGVSGQVDYWYFDSKEATNNLRMTKDSTGKYFLNSSSEVVKGKTTTGITSSGNFFPFNGSGQSGNSGKLNYGFGTKLEIPFRLTEDGTVINSDTNTVPIEFNFSGDDDIWIFVDGKLALDLGGDHGIVSGYLNFRDLEYHVDYVKGTSSGISQNKTGKFTINGNKTDKHTLTLFYMERGIWESNMYMSFNFPDENYLEVEKEVDVSDVNEELFGGLFDNYSFGFDIRNQATHYASKDVGSNTDALTGFITKQYDIPDYGSAVSGALEYPNGAYYTKMQKSGTTTDGQLGADGAFQLSDGDSIVFRDQFRRGSYIGLTENLNAAEQELFSTLWTMYENGVPVTSMADGNNVDLGADGSNTSLENVSSLSVDDGRTEVYKSGFDADGVEMSNIGYPASKKPDDSTFVFRSYQYPYSDTMNTQLKVLYTNKVKTGSITIKKDKLHDTDVLNGDYTFTITFTNVGGIDLEGNEVISKTVTLRNGESITLSGIPVNTEYTITEITSDGTVLADVAETNGKTFTFDSNLGKISGTIDADLSDYNYEFTFKNTNPLTNIKVTKVDAANPDIKLSDVEFKLEKLNADNTVDTDFTEIIKSTDGQGVAKFENLSEGTYRLTEIKTNDEYSLLKDPIIIVINRSGGNCTIDGDNCTVDTDDTISLVISNRKKFELPSTGGRGRTTIILAGLILIWIAGLTYIVKKERKEYQIKKEN